MSSKKKVALILGSPRAAGSSRKLAAALCSLAPQGMELGIVEIRDLALFNPDLDQPGGAPQPWSDFREAVLASDAVIFITPEYNRSVPAVLKNALEIGSRPYKRQAWTGKPAAIISQSTGMVGGFGANHHLRQILVFLDMHVLPQPEMYLSQVDKLFDEGGSLLPGPGADLLKTFMERFEAFVPRHSK
jgi:chromate reductase